LSAVVAELRQAQGTLDAFTDTDDSADVRAVLSWSYRALTEPAAGLFRLWALHPGTEIGVPAAASLAGHSAGQTRALLRELVAAGLASEPQPGRYSRHDLLGAYAHELLDLHDSGSQRQEAVARMLDHHLHTAYAGAGQLHPLPDIMAVAGPVAGVRPQPLAGYQEALDWFKAEHATLLALLGQAGDAGFPDHVWRLAWYLRHYLDRQGQWHDLAVSQQAAMAAAEESGNQLGMAYAHRGLARADHNDGRIENAADHLDRALLLFERHGDKLAMAYTYCQALTMRTYLGDHDGAFAMAQNALTVFHAANEPAGEAAAHLAVGSPLISLGRHDEALAHGRQAIALFERMAASYSRALAVGTVALAYHHLGRYDDAIENYVHCIEQLRSLGGLRDVPSFLLELGATYRTAGRNDEADAIEREARTILENLGSPDGIVRYDTVRAENRP
jgi:tetratricopeptide (TPR) repeat protein